MARINIGESKIPKNGADLLVVHHGDIQPERGRIVLIVIFDMR